MRSLLFVTLIGGGGASRVYRLTWYTSCANTSALARRDERSHGPATQRLTHASANALLRNGPITVSRYQLGVVRSSTSGLLCLSVTPRGSVLNPVSVMLGELIPTIIY